MWPILAALLPSSPAPDQVFIDATLIEVCGRTDSARSWALAAQSDPSTVGVGLAALAGLDGVEVKLAPQLLTPHDEKASVHTGVHGVSAIDLAVRPTIAGDVVELEIKASASVDGWVGERKARLSLRDGHYAALGLGNGTCSNGDPSSWVLFVRPFVVGSDGDLGVVAATTAAERARYESAMAPVQGKRTRKAVGRALVEMSGLGFALPTE